MSSGTSLVVQWLRIHLPVQGTWLLHGLVKIPHATRQLSLCVTAAEPWAATPEARLPVVQSLRCVWLLATPQTAACQASLSFTVFQSLLKLMSIESLIPPSHLILCHPLLMPSCVPASRSFPMSRLFASGGPSIGASGSASVLPMDVQGWPPLGWTGPRVPQLEKASQWEALTQQWRVATAHCNWEKPACSNKDPAQPKVH